MIWINIPEYPNYDISDWGMLRRHGAEMTTPIGKNGYSRKYLKEYSKNILIHRMVAKMFIPNPESLPFVNHKDHNRINNNVSNLEWCTALQNQRHARTSGRFPPQQKGEHAPAAKLSLDAVRIIREALKIGFSKRGIARYFKISPSTIHLINIGVNSKGIC